MRDFSRHPHLRVATLCVFSFGAITRGAAYLESPDTDLTVFVDRLVPLDVWAVVWIVAGALILAGVWHRLVARWAVALGSSLWMVWGISYLWATWVGDSSRGWVTGTLMLTLAGSMLLCGALMDEQGPPPGPVIPDDPPREGHV